MKPSLKKTYSTFSDNSVPKRENQIRRDNDLVKTPACTLYDVDYNIHWFLTEWIRPYIIDDNKRLEVPLYFANGELLSQIQKHGYLRESSTGKIITPVMTIRRSSLEERQEYKHLNVNVNPADIQQPPGNVITYKAKYTKKNRYDRFSTQVDTRPSEEYYVTHLPEYVLISYELNIWAEYIEHLNQLVQQIQPKSGHAWGDTWKFTTQMRGYTFDDSIDVGSDRVVKANVTLEVQAALLHPDELRASSMAKAYSPKKVVFTTEVVSNIPKSPEQ
jgi:hypothetical protein